jgi:undecaprenyl-diphosphatase
MFLVVIQLGAILAVLVLYWPRLSPVAPGGRPGVTALWTKILLACAPAAVVGFLLDDALDALFYNYQTVAVTLILYGLAFVWLERRNRRKVFPIQTLNSLPYPTAVGIGLFQLLALIPGTSRSGATILGAMLLGAARPVAAEFSFFLAIPVMAGASLLKLAKFGLAFAPGELALLLAGTLVAFGVSLAAIRFLMGYLARRDFTLFGWYRVGLGLLVIGFFLAR